MSASSAIRPVKSIQGRYVVLTFAGMPLVLPDTDVYTLEPSSDVQPGGEADGVAGWIQADGRRWPVVCLDQNLGMTTLVPAERRVCVLLHHEAGYAGVLCEAVTTLEAESCRSLSLPPVLSTPGSPVRGLVQQEGFLGCLTSSAALLGSLSLQAGLGPPSPPESRPGSEVHP